MKCIFCGCLESKVIDSRSTEDGSVIRRRRECESCKKRFTTYETVEMTTIRVVKSDGNRQDFDPSKIKAGTPFFRYFCSLHIRKCLFVRIPGFQLPEVPHFHHFTEVVGVPSLPENVFPRTNTRHCIKQSSAVCFRSYPYFLPSQRPCQDKQCEFG
jgi:hypothetical protein